MSDAHSHGRAAGHAGGHAHHHGHGHGRGDARGALALALVLNAAFLVLEVVVGLSTGSLALLSDAAHMLGDVGALALALGAAQLARRPAGDHMTFGLVRAETLGAFVNGVAMVVASVVIVYEAVGRLAHGAPEVPGGPILVVGAAGLAVNLGSAYVLWRSHRDNLNVRGALLHMLADALGSVGAIVAGALVLVGFDAADAIASLAIAVLVAWATWSILRDSGRILLQLPPHGLDVDAVRETLLATRGATGIHDLHAWSLDGVTSVVTAHVVIAAGADADVTRCLALAALRELHGIEHATLQVERPVGPCEMDGCGAPARAVGDGGL